MVPAVNRMPGARVRQLRYGNNMTESEVNTGSHRGRLVEESLVVTVLNGDSDRLAETNDRATGTEEDVEEPVLRCVRNSEYARLPEYGTQEAAGLDLFSAGSVTIPPGTRRTIPTDISVEIPAGCYLRVAPRSGLAWYHWLDVKAGVIDRDYQGDIQILVHNSSTTPYLVKRGDRIAQGIVERILRPKVVEVMSINRSSKQLPNY